MNLKKLNEVFGKMLESNEDIDRIAQISQDALRNDNFNQPNRNGMAYISRGGDNTNFRLVLEDVINIVDEHDHELADSIRQQLPQIRRDHRIPRNTDFESIRQNDNDNRIVTYRYRRQNNDEG